VKVVRWLGQLAAFLDVGLQAYFAVMKAKPEQFGDHLVGGSARLWFVDEWRADMEVSGLSANIRTLQMICSVRCRE
jgi:hypothetical protein